MSLPQKSNVSPLSGPNPLNNWAKSRSFGVLVEQAFREIMEETLGLAFLCANDVDVKAVDLKRSGNVVDLKCLQSPYPKSPTPAGLTQEEHLTLDNANLATYDPATEIWMVVDYRAAGVETAGIFMIGAGKVMDILKDNPKRKYTRSARGSSDKAVKIGISTKEVGWFRLPGMSCAASAALVIQRARDIESRPLAAA